MKHSTFLKKLTNTLSGCVQWVWLQLNVVFPHCKHACGDLPKLLPLLLPQHALSKGHEFAGGETDEMRERTFPTVDQQNICGERIEGQKVAPFSDHPQGTGARGQRSHGCLRRRFVGLVQDGAELGKEKKPNSLSASFCIHV